MTPLASVKPRMPPPTVSGTKISFDASTIRASIGISVSGQSRKPVMLRKVISSAPCS